MGSAILCSNQEFAGVSGGSPQAEPRYPWSECEQEARK